MRERPYRLGLVLGRFQGLHVGHEAVIRKALSSRVTLQQVGERAFETIPVPWDVLMDRVIERYTLLVEKSRRGELKRKPV